MAKVSGSKAAAEQEWLSLTVKKCNSTLYSNCISDSDLEALQTQFGGDFRFFVTVKGNTVNPESA